MYEATEEHIEAAKNMEAAFYQYLYKRFGLTHVFADGKLVYIDFEKQVKGEAVCTHDKALEKGILETNVWIVEEKE